ncbi:response regulator transcription factor [Sinomicrobium sp.]
MSKQILIVEDEVIIANSIKIYLDSNGYESQVVTNPIEAGEAIATNKYDAIISDINLNSEVSGLELIENNVGEEVPVIFLTAYSDIDTMKSAERLMPYAYITKPFNKDHLLLTLNLAIANHKKRFIHQITDANSALDIRLSKRELEILRLMTQSMTTEEIADQLCISPLTVATHRKNIFRKTGAKSLLELVSLSVAHGWV